MCTDDGVIGRRDQRCCVAEANRDSFVDGGVRLDMLIIVAGCIQFVAVLSFVLPDLGSVTISWNRVFSGSVSTQCGVKLQRAPT